MSDRKQSNNEHSRLLPQIDIDYGNRVGDHNCNSLIRLSSIISYVTFIGFLIYTIYDSTTINFVITILFVIIAILLIILYNKTYVHIRSGNRSIIEDFDIAEHFADDHSLIERVLLRSNFSDVTWKFVLLAAISTFLVTFSYLCYKNYINEEPNIKQSFITDYPDGSISNDYILTEITIPHDNFTSVNSIGIIIYDSIYVKPVSPYQYLGTNRLLMDLNISDIWQQRNFTCNGFILTDYVRNNDAFIVTDRYLNQSDEILQWNYFYVFDGRDIVRSCVLQSLSFVQHSNDYLIKYVDLMSNQFASKTFSSPNHDLRNNWLTNLLLSVSATNLVQIMCRVLFSSWRIGLVKRNEYYLISFLSTELRKINVQLHMNS